MRDIGKNLKQLREQKGLTQDQLAEQLFVTRQTISNYENGRSRPDIDTLLKIAELLNSDVNSILYGPPVPEDKRSDKRRFIIGAVVTAVLCVLWLVGCTLFYLDFNFKLELPEGQMIPYSFWLYGKLFFKPYFMLFLGWTLLQGVSLVSGANPINSPKIKYARWATVAVVIALFYCISPYVFNWSFDFIPILNDIFPREKFIEIPIAKHFSIEIIELNSGFPWFYFLLGALLWLFGFPQKKNKSE